MGQGTGKVSKSAEDASDPAYSLAPPLPNVYAPYGSPVEVGSHLSQFDEWRGKRDPNQAYPKSVDRDKIPFVFRWEYGGCDVSVCGSFSNWATKLPLTRSCHGDFSAIVELPKGTHEYKFYVDGKWIHDPCAETTDNNLGSFNNVVHVTRKDFEAFYNTDFLNQPSTGLSSSPPGSYSQTVPARSSATGLPPHLPPLLQQTILNSDLPSDEDPTLLSEPNHVVLNHLYALSVKDHVLVLAATHRYKEKCVCTSCPFPEIARRLINQRLALCPELTAPPTSTGAAN